MLMGEFKATGVADVKVNKLKDAWLEQLRKNSGKSAALSMVAVSLAACGGGTADTVISSSTSTVETGTGDVAEATDQTPGGQTEITANTTGATDSIDSALPTRVSIEVNHADDMNNSLSNDFDTLDVVFNVSASFDGSSATSLKQVNLGLDPNGVVVASQGNVDFDELIVDTLTINVHSAQRDIEFDFNSELASSAELKINFMSDASDIIIGSTRTSIDVLNANSLTLEQMSDSDVKIDGATNIDGSVETLVIQNNGAAGTLDAGERANVATIEGGSGLKTVEVNFSVGDAIFQSSSGAIHGFGSFIDDITNLQTYTIKADQSNILSGAVGVLGSAEDLEIISIDLKSGASLNHDTIYADTSKISLVDITGSFANTEVVATPTISGTFNIYLDGLRADKIVQQNITAVDGAVFLDNQRYEVGDQVFSGTGDIVIRAADFLGSGDPGYIQTQAAEASAHSGNRTFIDGTGFDVIYGSNQDDLIQFTSFSFSFNGEPNSTYNDAGGNDHVVMTGAAAFVLNDGTAGTDDVYDASNAGSFLGANVTFNAGSGNDIVTFSPTGSFGSNVLVDFGSYSSGTVQVMNFETGTHKISFDGIDGITTSTGTAVAAGARIAGSSVDDNKIYVLANGDTAVDGISISDYTSLEDVAAFLNVVAGDSSGQTTALFVINNGAISGATGDDFGTYIYKVTKDDTSVGFEADDVALIGMTTNVGAFGFPSSGITVADIV